MPTSDTDSIDTNKIYSRKEVAERISLEEIKNKYPSDRQEEIEMLYNVIYDVLTSQNHISPTFRVSKQNIAFKSVKQALKMLEKSHIEYVLDSLAKNDNKYKIKGRTDNYLRTALFHSLRTISYYHNHSFKKPEQPKDKFIELVENKIKRDMEKFKNQKKSGLEVE